MRRRSIVEFEQNLKAQIDQERAALVEAENDIAARRVRIETLESVQSNLKATNTVEEVPSNGGATEKA